MKRPFVFFTALLLFASTKSLSYNEDEVRSRDGDFTYLDYVKEREQEYEYAMHLRDAMRREGDNYPGLDDDGFDEERDDENDSQELYDEEEDGNEEEDDKSRRNLKSRENMKEPINRKDNIHHIKANNGNEKLKDTKKSNYIKKKKDKYSTTLRKDEKNLKENVNLKSDARSSKRSKLKDILDNGKSLKESEGNTLAIEENMHKPGHLSGDSVPHGIAKEQSDKVSQSNDDPSTLTTTQTPNTMARQPGPVPKQITPKKTERKRMDKALFVVVIAACSVAGVAGLILAGYCWYRLRAEQDSMPEEDTKKYVKRKKKPKKIELTNDEKLAKSAEVYHYMHTKKQLASMEKNGSQRRTSNVESETSDEESDNTVYECPGLAPPGDMKVVNPLFSDAEREHSDARSDGSHISSPTPDKSSPQNETEKKDAHE